MARARSTAALQEQRARAGDSYRAQIVFAFRQFELSPKDKKAADLLLSLIPKDDREQLRNLTPKDRDDDQQVTLMTLGDALCDAEPFSDMNPLGSVRDKLPHEFAEAVLLVPNYMPKYISYSLVAVGDPHSDYAVQMQMVCRKAHSEFMRAIGALTPDDQKWFANDILDATTCRALKLPEGGWRSL